MLQTLTKEARAPIGDKSFEENRIVHAPFEHRPNDTP